MQRKRDRESVRANAQTHGCVGYCLCGCVWVWVWVWVWVRVCVCVGGWVGGWVGGCDL
jgi:hypothetical protein